MARSINKVTLLGNLGRSPEVRFTQDGMKVIHFSVATHELWQDKNTGNKKEHTEWHHIVVLNDRLADIAEQYLKKGSKVYIEGQLQTRQWKDQKGQERYITEIVLSRYHAELVLLDTKESNSTTESHHTEPIDFGEEGVTSTEDDLLSPEAFKEPSESSF